MGTADLCVSSRSAIQYRGNYVRLNMKQRRYVRGWALRGTYISDFMGGCPPLPLSEKRVNLQVQLIKFLGVIGLHSLHPHNLRTKQA